MIDIKTTKVTRVFTEGDWGRALRLADLEQFLNDARKAGVGEDDRIVAGVSNSVDQVGVLYTLEMKITETSQEHR